MPRPSDRGRLRLLALSAVVIAGAAALATPVGDAWREAQATGDVVASADWRLAREFTPDRLAREFDDALDKGDVDLASSLNDLATDRGLVLTPERRKRFDDLRNDHSPLRAARDFGAGFADGDTRSGAALTGAIAADLSGFGDLRELAREGSKWMAGGEADALVVGLSAAGLALTAATWTTLGAAMPARGGLTLAKTLQKSGRLSKPLAAEMSRIAQGAIDSGAMKASVAAVARLDLTAARQASAALIKPQAMAGFRAFGADVSTIYGRAGMRGAQDVLAVAATRGEVAAGARLAAAKGSRTRAVLKVLGRGALVAVSLSMTAFGWMMTAILWFFAAAAAARRFGEMIGRGLWRIVDWLRPSPRIVAPVSAD